MSSDEKARRKGLRDSYKHAQMQAAMTALALDRPALDELLDHLDQEVTGEGCDHSLRFTQAWVEQQGFDWEPLKVALGDAGGYCDCEVLANVDPHG